MGHKTKRAIFYMAFTFLLQRMGFRGEIGIKFLHRDKILPVLMISVLILM